MSLTSWSIPSKEEAEEFTRAYLSAQQAYYEENIRMEDKPNKITAALKVVATGEFYDDEASEETLRYCVEQDLEDAGFDVDVEPLKEQNWISVRDRLPNCNGCYLVWRPHFYPDKGMPSICYFDGQNAWHDSYGVDFTRTLAPDDVSHWMPLPEQPCKAVELE